MKKKIAHRLSEEHIETSYFSIKIKRHYSQDMLRKAKLAKSAVDKGEDLKDVAIRYLGTDGKSILDSIANQ